MFQDFFEANPKASYGPTPTSDLGQAVKNSHLGEGGQIKKKIGARQG
jgi:hypothetical protein